MLPFIKKIPETVRSVIQRLLIGFLMLLISRVVFFLANQSRFSSVNTWDWCSGIWFDFITLCLFFFPFYSLYMLPIPLTGYRWHTVLFRVGFHLINGFLIGVNFIDTGYYSYTLKRSTRELFQTAINDNHWGDLASAILLDFWWLIVLFVLLIALSDYLYRKTARPQFTFQNAPKGYYRRAFFEFIAVVPLLFLIARGGIRPKPIGIIDATMYASSVETTDFILNTPFTLLKTVATETITEKRYLSLEEEQRYFNPIRTSQPQNLLPEKTNVVILVLESFGMEFVGALSGNETFTPFLDSILGQSLFFEHGFANGKKSVEAIPAIVSSIPSLLDEPYLNSTYASNTIESLPKQLHKIGYQSAFFHGATNGSMRFDAFAKLAGFDYYFGRREYDNDAHYDGTWGIFDHHFNPWAAKKISQLNAPFCSVLFTVSSHHPYRIPSEFQTRVKRGKQPIAASLNYADHSLKLFFQEAKKQPWYENTLFVLVADHSPSSSTPLYNQRTHMYRIPIAFFHPKGYLNPERRTEIVQQLDLFPTILDLLNVKTSYYAVGKSIFDRSKNPANNAVNYIGGTFFYYKNDFMLTFFDDRAQNLLNFTSSSIQTEDSLKYYQEEVHQSELELKALLQRFYRDLRSNTIRKL